MLTDTDLHHGRLSRRQNCRDAKTHDRCSRGNFWRGLADQVPLGHGPNSTIVFTDKTTDLRPSNAAAEAFVFSISPDYFRADGTTLLSGMAFSWHDDGNAPRLALINPAFARKIFGSVSKALGGYYKSREGARIQ